MMTYATKTRPKGYISSDKTKAMFNILSLINQFLTLKYFVNSSRKLPLQYKTFHFVKP